MCLIQSDNILSLAWTHLFFLFITFNNQKKEDYESVFHKRNIKQHSGGKDYCGVGKHIFILNDLSYRVKGVKSLSELWCIAFCSQLNPDPACEDVLAQPQVEDEVLYSKVHFFKNHTDPLFSTIETLQPREEQHADYTVVKYRNNTSSDEESVVISTETDPT